VIDLDKKKLQQSDRYLASLALFVAFFFVFISRGMADTWLVFFLPIEQEFSSSRQQSTGVYSAYMLVSGLGGPFSGLMMSRFGARICYTTGVIFIAAGTLLACISSSLWQFYLYIGVFVSLGISAIGIVPASTIISRWFPNNLSTAMATVYAALGTGSLLLVPLVQWVIDREGWRNAYAMLGFIMLFMILIVLVLPWKKITNLKTEVLDHRGSYVEADKTITLSQAVFHPLFLALLFSFGFTGFSMYLVIVQIVPLLMDVGNSPLRSATIFGVSGMLSVFGVLSSGWISDRVGLRPVALISFCLSLTGIFCLLRLTYSTSEWSIVAFICTFGLAQGARGPIVATMSNRLFVGPAGPVIFGVIHSASMVGAGAGAWLSGFLHDVSGSYRMGLFIAAIGMISAAIPFLTIKSFRNPTPIPSPFR